MPEGLLNVVPENKIREIADSSVRSLPREMDYIKEPNRSLLFWLLDVMVSRCSTEVN